ncbi:MAG: rhomboid family intramembrane serine protease [Pseudoprimorskyibacter sp.]|jgi:rhomboid protease GluP|nr:rhomboid family intramembrane serine protease [Pseudoprimorskyibacter sp.]
MSHDPDIRPVNPLPPTVMALFLVILAMEGAFFLGSAGIIGGAGAVGWRLAWAQSFAFVPEIWWQMFELGQFPLSQLRRTLAYIFIHPNFTSAIFGGIMLLAMGKIVGEALGAFRALMIYLLSGVGGAIIYALLVPTGAPILGSFPAVYGMIGGFTFLVWLSLGMHGAPQARAFSLIAMLMAIQLIFSVFSGGMDWVADLGGFVTGFSVAALLVPGGWSRIIEKLRGR